MLLPSSVVRSCEPNSRAATTPMRIHTVQRGNPVGRVGRGPGGPPTPPERPRQPGRPTRPTGLPRWTVWILIGVVAALLFGSQLLTTDDGKSISYNEFMTAAKNGQVASAKYNNDSGTISGELTDQTKFTTTGPIPLPDADQAILQEKVTGFEFNTPTSSWVSSLIPLLLPFVLLLGLFIWMQRRAA